MSAIYQDQEFAITEQDLAQVEQELNSSDDYQTLIVTDEDYLNRLLSRWEDCQVPGVEFSDEELDVITAHHLSESEEEEWLQYENMRMESDLFEIEQNQMI